MDTVVHIKDKDGVALCYGAWTGDYTRLGGLLISKPQRYEAIALTDTREVCRLCSDRAAWKLRRIKTFGRLPRPKPTVRAP